MSKRVNRFIARSLGHKGLLAILFSALLTFYISRGRITQPQIEVNSDSAAESELVHENQFPPAEGHSCFDMCTSQGDDESDCEDECLQDA